MASKGQNGNQLVYFAVIVVLVAVIIYFATSSYYNQHTASLESKLNVTNSSYNNLKTNYNNLEFNYSNLKNSFDSLNNNYNQLKSSFGLLNNSYNQLQNQVRNPPTTKIYSNKQITLNTLFYPDYIGYGYNTTYLGYFYPTFTYLYYDVYSGSYMPLSLINSSYADFNFNITELSNGYLTLNYTTSSNVGIDLSNSDCLANLFTEHTLALDAVSDGNSQGSIVIPIHQGKNCLYIENSGNQPITVTFSATYVQYVS